MDNLGYTSSEGGQLEQVDDMTLKSQIGNNLVVIPKILEKQRKLFHTFILLLVDKLFPTFL